MRPPSHAAGTDNSRIGQILGQSIKPRDWKQSDDRQRPVIERGQCQQGNIGGATAKTDAGIERGGYRKQQRQAEN